MDKKPINGIYNPPPPANQEPSTPSALAALLQYAFRSSVTVVPTHSLTYLFHPSSEPVRSASLTPLEHWDVRNQAPEPKSYSSSESSSSKTASGSSRTGPKRSASPGMESAYSRLKGGICMFRAGGR